MQFIAGLPAGIFKRYLFGILLLLLCEQLTAQSRRIPFQHLQEGLSHPVITSICQDYKGFMWFGTPEGLNRFDGTTFVIYEKDPRHAGSLSHNYVTVVFEDKQHTLWVGTATGLNRYNREKDEFERLYLKKDKPVYINAIGCDSLGNLWVGTAGSGLYKYDGINKTLTAYVHGRSTRTINSDFVTALHADKYGNIWAGTRNGLDLLEKEQSRFTHFTANATGRQSLSHNNITCIRPDGAGNIWVGTYGGGINRILKTADGYAFQQYKKTAQPGSLSNNNVLCMLADRKGNLWVGTENGGLNCIYRNTNRFELYLSQDGNPQSLSSNSIWSLYEDRSGILWVGNYSKGLNIYDPNFEKFDHYQHNNYEQHSLPSDNVKSFSEDDKGNLWIGTDGGGVTYFNTRNHSFREPIKKEALGNVAVQTVLYDSRNRIWIGTWGGGLDCFSENGSKIKNYRFTGSQNNGRNNIKVVYEDKSGHIWVGTSGSGLYVYNKKADAFIPVVDSTQRSHLSSTSYINDIIEDSNHVLWVGASYGLIRIRPGSSGGYAFACYLYNTPFNKDRNSMSVNCLLEDSRHRLWLGTGDDLTLFDRQHESFTVYNKQNGLPYNTINSIVETRPGVFYITSNKGIFEFDSNRHKVKAFSSDDGSVNNQFYPRSCIKTKSGELFFGGNNGITAFYPEKIKSNHIIPPVYITGFKLFDEPAGRKAAGSPVQKNITETSQLTLRYYQTSFSVEFAALNFTHAQRNQYQYKLQGFDKQWNYAGNRHTATYTNLDPGKYVFSVKGANNEGVWNPKPASITITVLPPLWRTAWAYASYVLFIIALIWIFIKLRIEKVAQTEKLRLEHEHRIKTDELSKIKTQFFTNVSHELRTPLSLILGPLEEIINTNQFSDSMKEKLNLIYDNCGKLYGLVNELMDFTKVEDNRLKMEVYRYDIIKFAQHVYLLFLDEAGRRRIDYRFIHEDEELKLWFDRRKLEKVIINLIKNAFKYTPNGGQIILQIEKVMVRHQAHLPEASEQVKITVTDNGSGIAEQNLDKIFDRFFQGTDNKAAHAEGTGIGLALVKNLVELHHGTITVSSEMGVRTSFEVMLPLNISHFNADDIAIHPEEETQPFQLPAKPQPAKAHNASAPLILIAEDNFALRAYLASVLADDYRIIEAIDGEEAYLLTMRDMPDLVISDVMMPRSSGTELCRKIKTDVRTSHIPVILLTAGTTVAEQVEGISTGADAYITKPFSVEVLQVHIRKIIAFRRELLAHFSQDVYFRPQNLAANELDAAFIQKVTDHILSNITDSDLGVESISEAFSTTSGIGMSILRVMVPTSSSSFAAEKPSIDAAKSFGAKVIATAWNAPSSMMSGNHLNTASYAAYAAHLSAYNSAVGGVYAISPFNEPNYSGSGWMEASATEVANFVAAQGSNCGAPIMAPEPFNMDQNFLNTYLGNTTAKSKTSFVCGHIYGKTPYNVGNIGKSLWMTEHYTNSSISGNDWNNAITAAKEIHDCMTAGWSAYVWWYIRRSYGPIDENGNITKLGYVMAQFSRYIRPGYSKVSCTANPTSGVYVTAYKSGSKLVMVIVNQNTATTYQNFSLSGVSVSGFNRYYTTSSDNLASNTVSVSGGSFGINLAPSSVTTLVSQ